MNASHASTDNGEKPITLVRRTEMHQKPKPIMVPCLVFGHGQREDGSPDGETTERCRLAANELKADRCHSIVVAAQGIVAEETLAQSMRGLLAKYQVSPNRVIAPKGRANSTEGQAAVFLSWMEEISEAHAIKNLTVILSESDRQAVEALFASRGYAGARFITTASADQAGVPA